LIEKLMWHAIKKHHRERGCRFYGKKGKRYQLFWMGGKERSDGIFAAEKWVERVVSVERHSERVLILKMVLDNG